MKKYTDTDMSNFRFQVLDKLGYIGRKTVPSYGATTDTHTWIKENAPKFDFFWSRATDRSKAQMIVTLMGKNGPIGIAEDEDKFPSDELITKIRLVLP